MTIGADEFRTLLGALASSVTVVTTRKPDGAPTGFTATAFSSVSLDPPLVLVCLDRKADCHPAFAEASAFVVSVLDASQKDVALKLATRGDDKLEGVPTTPGEATGIPAIDGAIATIECRLVARHPGGDHTIIVGEIVRGERRDGDPLLYRARAFGRFTPER